MILRGVDPALDRVVDRCDCWPETALRIAPPYAKKPTNHDPGCPYAMDAE